MGTLADFNQLKPSTRYPYVLVIPQTVTERVLGELVQEIGISVYRPFKVIGLHPDVRDHNYTSVLFESGHSVREKYVIGADGARSVVSSLEKE